MSRFAKKQPEYVYFWGTGEWVQGPYVKPHPGRDNRKYLLTEVPMDLPKVKKKK